MSFEPMKNRQLTVGLDKKKDDMGFSETEKIRRTFVPMFLSSRDTIKPISAK